MVVAVLCGSRRYNLHFEATSWFISAMYGATLLSLSLSDVRWHLQDSDYDLVVVYAAAAVREAEQVTKVIKNPSGTHPDYTLMEVPPSLIHLFIHWGDRMNYCLWTQGAAVRSCSAGRGLPYDRKCVSRHFSRPASPLWSVHLAAEYMCSRWACAACGRAVEAAYANQAEAPVPGSSRQVYWRCQRQGESVH